MKPYNIACEVEIASRGREGIFTEGRLKAPLKFSSIIYCVSIVDSNVQAKNWVFNYQIAESGITWYFFSFCDGWAAAAFWHRPHCSFSPLSGLLWVQLYIGGSPSVPLGLSVCNCLSGSFPHALKFADCLTLFCGGSSLHKSVICKFDFLHNKESPGHSSSEHSYLQLSSGVTWATYKVWDPGTIWLAGIMTSSANTFRLPWSLWPSQ